MAAASSLHEVYEGFVGFNRSYQISMATKYNDPEREGEEEEEEDEEEEVGSQGEVWDDWQSDEEDASSDYMCLFCDLRYDSTERLLEHCKFVHSFDFRGIVRELKMDFYGSFKLINYIRSQVAINKCWSCDLLFKCITDLQNHLHTADNIKKDGKFPWDDDLYLKPFMIDDALLHSFADDEDEEEFDPPVTKEEILSELINDGDIAEIYNSSHDILDNEKPQTSACHDIRRDVTAEENVANLSEKSKSNGIGGGSGNEELTRKRKDCQLKVSFANVVSREIKNANDSYFGSYGSFGIHREMISDKVRTEAYRIAILNNPSLLNQATIMDVGCGTGILSLFAAQAGVSRVIAVEASLKMATIATQIAKDNGFLYEENNKGEKGEENHCSGVIDVVQTMVEELDKLKKIPPHSVDVLVSEWMGYCLLYESMLSSVLYARDHWLKPGGAILPDTATIFVAGFGRGGTSLPFWENVYGFNMSCIGKEVMEDAACFPIVDVMDSKDIVTKSVVLQTFDLTTMKPDEMDFTSSCELVLKPSTKEGSADSEALICLCYGIVLWFEASFTNRFCKETPTVLSTSPYSPKTHWSQAIFTFQEPIAMTYTKAITGYDGVLGTEQCPAARISSRISIARSSVHRSIDISMETTGISVDGRKRRWPVQIFNL